MSSVNNGENNRVIGGNITRGRILDDLHQRQGKGVYFLFFFFFGGGTRVPMDVNTIRHMQAHRRFLVRARLCFCGLP